MAKDFGVYWPYFSKPEEDWPVDGWRIGSGSILTDASDGDRIWLFTSGQKCRKKLEHLGQDTAGVVDELAYLAQVLTVKSVEPDPVGQFASLINADEQASPAVEPPLLIDPQVRPGGRDTNIPIGTLRQSPYRLADNAVDLLKNLLARERPTAFQAVFGGGH